MLTSKNNSVGESTSQGLKRPLEDVSALADDSPDAKRMNLMDSFGNAQNLNMQAPRTVQNGVVVEDYKVPDKMVGLIIGRGGDQISRLQTESGCKVQLAHDSGGQPDRLCTLTGTKESIMKAKDMLNQIINRTGIPLKEFDHAGGQLTIEIMIPGSKAGLIIGKGGEKIKHLQESAGVKMIIVQDSPQATNHEKPLRITGEPYKCEHAKQMVMDILSEKDEGGPPHRGGYKRPYNEYSQMRGGGGPITDQILVPKPAVGVVIGKGGEMIKRLQSDSGAKVHFDQSKDNELAGDRLCIVNGLPEQVEMALNFINELIQSVMMRDGGHQPPPPPPHHHHHHPPPPHHHGGGMGRGRGRGRGRGSNHMDRGGGGAGPPRQDIEIQYSVPASRCGVIIGKGGENIRAINQQSGAHVELFKGAPPNPHEKLFIIRGSQGQIEHAQQLINEKINGPMQPPGGAPPNNHGGGPPPHFHGGHPPHPQHSSQPPHFPNAQSYQTPPNGPPPSQPPQYHAPQSWSTPYQQSYQAPQAPQVSVATVVAPSSITVAAPAPLNADQAKPASSDPNAAAWAAYYAYYNQPGATTAAPQAVQPSPITPVQTVMQQLPAPQPVVTAAAPAAATTASGQPDYSAAWAEYYRSLGMFREAEMVEQQARTAQTTNPQVAQPSYITQALNNPQPQTNAGAAQIVATLAQPVPTAPAVVASPGQWGTPYSHQPQATPATTYVGYGYTGYPAQ